MASGLASASLRSNRACIARGKGHCSLSSMIEGWSMLTITTGATGMRAPRTSKKRDSDQCSRGSSTPRKTRATTTMAETRPPTYRVTRASPRPPVIPSNVC